MSHIHSQVTSSNSQLESCVCSLTTAAEHFQSVECLNLTLNGGGLCWDYTSQPWMGKTTHHCTSITTAMKAAATEMHQYDIIQVGEILKEHHTQPSSISETTDRASHFSCWLAPTSQSFSLMYNMTTKDTMYSSHGKEHRGHHLHSACMRDQTKHFGH